MTNYDTRVQALKVYLPGVLVTARKPAKPGAYVNSVTMWFDHVRRVDRYVFCSRDNHIDKDGKPIEVCLPAPLIKHQQGKKFLSRRTEYPAGMYQVYGEDAIRPCLPFLR